LQQRSACEQHWPVQVTPAHWVPTPELAPALEPVPGCPDAPPLPEPGPGAPEEVPALTVPEELPALDVPEVPEPDELPEIELSKSDPEPASSVPNTNGPLLQPFAAANAPKKIIPAERTDNMRFMKWPRKSVKWRTASIWGVWGSGRPRFVTECRPALLSVTDSCDHHVRLGRPCVLWPQAAMTGVHARMQPRPFARCRFGPNRRVH
jgi:hypothetical protein